MTYMYKKHKNSIKVTEGSSCFDIKTELLFKVVIKGDFAKKANNQATDCSLFII